MQQIYAILECYIKVSNTKMQLVPKNMLFPELTKHILNAKKRLITISCCI